MLGASSPGGTTHIQRDEYLALLPWAGLSVHSLWTIHAEPERLEAATSCSKSTLVFSQPALRAPPDCIICFIEVHMVTVTHINA